MNWTREASNRTLVYLFLLIFLTIFSVSIQASETAVVDSLTLSQDDFEIIENTEQIDTTAIQPTFYVEPLPEPVNVAEARTDSIDPNRNWWHLFKTRQLNLQDTTVQYPKFLKFCVDVYNWADHFFNSYNPEYVVGTGHRWKARLVSDNWTDSYALHFKRDKFNIRMLSDLNSNIGAYIHYMAVSVGYSLDLNTVFAGKKNDHSRFDFNFSCALFNADVSYYKTDGTYIRQFTGYNLNRLVKIDFPGVKMTNFNASIYYFFNNKKYSQGAAYNFSKIQKRSAGSWIAGFSYNNLDLAMDFGTLPENLQALYKFESEQLKFHYYSYCLIGGYGYNWVLHPKWLFNVTALPSIGVIHCYEDASDGSGKQLSLNIHGRASLTYNHRNFFLSLIGKISGNWYTSKNLSLFNAIEYFSANVGFRF